MYSLDSLINIQIDILKALLNKYISFLQHEINLSFGNM
jgi:hypothetical protein